MMKTLTYVALVAGCAIALGVPVAQAQTADTHSLMNTGDREARILKECGPITNAHLRAGCIDSIELEEQPSVGSHEVDRQQYPHVESNTSESLSP